jgi:nitroreductase
MELSEVMRTTAAVRDFTDEPVPDDVLYAILDDARFAPSGGNRQGWRVVVVQDPAQRRRLADLCAPVWGEYMAQGVLGETPFSVVQPTRADLAAAAGDPPPNPLFAHIETVPVVLVVAVDLGALAVSDKDLDRHSIVGGGSVYPFCHNILLAARERGIGGVMTTFLARAEDGARDVLGLPDGYAIASMAVLGHPVKQLTKLRRAAVEDVTTIDRFDGAPFTG